MAVYDIVLRQRQAEQLIFTSLKRYRETGKFLKLRPDVAVEKISVILAANGPVNSNGLSPVARAEAEDARKYQELRRGQAVLKQLFTRIDGRVIALKCHLFSLEPSLAKVDMPLK